MGEVGKAIYTLLATRKDFKIYTYDAYKETENSIKYMSVIPFEILHICIPFSKTFKKQIIGGIKYFKPKLTIIHSTVPVGTTEEIYKQTKANIIHSPIKGIHPNLYEGIKTFKKFIGPTNKKSRKLAEEHFKELNLKYETLKDSNTTEHAKLQSTLYYATCIEFHRDLEMDCNNFKTDFKDIIKFNKDYNEGYEKLGMKNVIRPILHSPGNKPLGGHCLTSNAKILKKQSKNRFARLIH